MPSDRRKNNLDPQDNKLNARPNQKLQINGAQRKTEANQSGKEIEGARARRDIVRSSVPFANFYLTCTINIFFNQLQAHKFSVPFLSGSFRQSFPTNNQLTNKRKLFPR